MEAGSSILEAGEAVRERQGGWEPRNEKPADEMNPGWASLRVKRPETDTDRSFRLQAQRLR